MRKPKICLETTLFNYYFEPEREAHADTVRLFDEIKQGKYEAFTSIAVVEELEKAPDEKRNRMIDLLKKCPITILQVSEEVKTLAIQYVAAEILPLNSLTDAQHIAAATVYEMDMIVSLNFKHIVRRKTVEMTGFFNLRAGYKPVAIYSPMEIVENG